MDGLNSVQIIGNLGSEPEMRYLANGTATTTFKVAVNRSYTSNGEKREEAEWFRVVCWAKLAELTNTHLEKGRKVYVEGRQQTRSWEKDGQKHYMTELVANKVLFLSSNGSSGGEAYEPIDADDVPFDI